MLLPDCNTLANITKLLSVKSESEEEDEDDDSSDEKSSVLLFFLLLLLDLGFPNFSLGT
ncbi:hypothetical protein QCA50_015974 [Cerrena zonata]|uniref:Uncharacterized protein n=1 Tax=Cerrena zonata TaxID=2478898 RepID=A0AAW0FIN2_9APHY